MKKCFAILFALAAVLFAALTVNAAELEAGYHFGSFAPNGTVPIDLGYEFSGEILFEYDLYVPANITAANNAVVFGDSLNGWASVGPALYINGGWSGNTDWFYTQDATGNGSGRTVNSPIVWKNAAATASKPDYTTYHVEETIDTTAKIANGYGKYEIYMTKEGGERTLVTVNGWHGFRTSYQKISQIGVWSNYGIDMGITNLTAKWLDGDTAEVTVNYIIDGEAVESHSFLRGRGESFVVPVDSCITYSGADYLPMEIPSIESLDSDIVLDVIYVRDSGQSMVDDYKVERSAITAVGNDVSVTYTVTPYNDAASTLFAALAAYDETGALSRIKLRRADVSENKTFTVRLTLPSGGNTYRVCSVLWSENIQPIVRSGKKEVQSVNEKGFALLSGVKLTDGMFKTSQNTGLDYIMSMDVDRLLAPSFEMAGLAAPNGASRYAGWEAKAVHGWGSDNFTLAGHSLGHWMSAAAVMYASTGDEELRSRLDYAVGQLGVIQNKTGSGYVGGVNVDCFNKLFSGDVSNWASGYWVPWYGVHKIYQGLIDAYLYTGNENALDVAVKFADWAVAGCDNLSDSQMQTMLDVEYGGMNEVFAELYEITQNEDYLRTAIRFTHNKILDPLSNSRDELTGLHANTQIPKIIGAAAIFENDAAYSNYAAAAKYFWNAVVKTRSYAIGGNSISEHFEALGNESLGVKTAESCNTYNMLKLTEHLFDWDHDSRYMDFYETALYNHVLGSQDPDTGNKMYFVSLLQGHYRIYGTAHDSFWCCTGTGMENPGRYGKCIYYEDGNDLYVNLYIPSQLDWSGNGLVIAQETDYPYSDEIKIKVVSGSADAKIFLRVPSWANQGASAQSGGETYTAESGYLAIERNWSAGDEIILTIPMELSKYTSRTGQAVFTYGPVVLAAPLGSDGLPEDTVISETGLNSTTTPVDYLLWKDESVNAVVSMIDREKLEFKINGEYTSSGKDITLIPFYSIHHQFHNVYWNVNTSGNAFLRQLNQITIDSVEPDGQQDELGHNFQGKNTDNGTFDLNSHTYMWRDAWGSSDAYFSYDLAVEPDAKNYLCVMYYGSDGGFAKSGVSYSRLFDISVDDERIATQSIDRNDPGNMFYCFYEIPESLTAGKTSVTVKFAPQTGNYCAGGVFEVRTVKKDLYNDAYSVAWTESTENSPWTDMGNLTAYEGSSADIAVTSSVRYQTLTDTPWGGCFNERGWYAMRNLPDAEKEKIMVALFAEGGLNLSIGRMALGNSDYSINRSTSYDELPSGVANDYDLEYFSLDTDKEYMMPYIDAAMKVKPDLPIWGSPWSPPSWMKNNKTIYGGGDNTIIWSEDVLKTYANYFVKYIEGYRALGYNVFMVMPQNEPTMDTAYSSCVWTGDKLNTFIRDYLSPAIKAAGLDTEIYLGTFTDSQANRTDPTLNDPETLKLISGLGFQWWSAPLARRVYRQNFGLTLMQSETKCGGGSNSWTYAEEQFDCVKEFFDAGVNAYMLWNMVLDEKGENTSPSPWHQNAPIIVDSATNAVTYTPQYYLFRHLSGQVKGGARRIKTTAGNCLAFQNPDGKIVLVVKNADNAAKTVTIGIDGMVFSANLAAHSINSFIADGSLDGFDGVDATYSEENASDDAYCLIKLHNVASGLTLSVDGASFDDGANIISWSDQGTADQLWYVEKVESGFIRFANYNSDKVIGVYGGSTDSGARAVQWTRDGTKNQDWQIAPVEKDGNTYYKIINRGSSLALAFESTENGTKAIQVAYTGADIQLWDAIIMQGELTFD